MAPTKRWSPTKNIEANKKTMAPMENKGASQRNTPLLLKLNLMVAVQVPTCLHRPERPGRQCKWPVQFHGAGGMGYWCRKR
mmetsp:Transcript_56656/g.91771  ORF Transcript_56656/g.91771 Transcript_56656/m.91771 type:complete len:81 (+) Transcript_56656:159-401(+)